MSLFRVSKLIREIIFFVVLTAIFVCLSTYIGYYKNMKTDSELASTYNELLASESWLNEVISSNRTIQTDFLGMIFSTNKEKYSDNLTVKINNLEKMLLNHDKYSFDSYNDKLYILIKPLLEQYKKAHVAIQEEMKQENAAEAMLYYENLEKSFDKVYDLTEKMDKYIEAKSVNIIKKHNNITSETNRFILFVLAGVMLLSIATGFLIAHMISKSLNEAVKNVRNIEKELALLQSNKAVLKTKIENTFSSFAMDSSLI